MPHFLLGYYQRRKFISYSREFIESIGDWLNGHEMDYEFTHDEDATSGEYGLTMDDNDMAYLVSLTGR